MRSVFRRVPPRFATSEFQPNVPYSGRFASVDVSPFNANLVLAASDAGGVFRSVNKGLSWQHVASLPLHYMNDVAFSGGSSNIAFATTAADGNPARDGLWVSRDSGASWSIVSPTWNTAGCSSHNEHGITVRPGTGDVYVGTECGLAVSHNSGTSWSAALNGSGNTLGLVSAAGVGPGTQVHLCGASPTIAGGAIYRRSTDNGAHFGAALNVGAGYACHGTHGQTAGSPFETGVAFVAVGSNQLVEIDGGGSSQTTLPTPDTNPNRPVWVRTRPTPGGTAGQFDLYWGSGKDVWRMSCHTGGTGLRCPATTGGWTRIEAGHIDSSWITFYTSNNCPAFISSDGGVGKFATCTGAASLVGTGPGGLNALQINDVAGQIHPNNTDLLFGTQDNFGWASNDDGATWSAGALNEGGGITFPRTSPTATDGAFYTCGGCPDDAAGGLRKFSPLMQSDLAWNSPGPNPGFPAAISPNVWVQSSGTAIYWSNDNTTTWHLVTGVALPGPNIDFVRVAGPPGAPTLYFPVRRANGTRGLARLDGVFSNRPTVAVADNGILGLSQWLGYRIALAVDHNNPQHLIAADEGDSKMKVSTNGGATWSPDAELTNAVTQNGALQFMLDLTGCQAHTIAFDPNDGRRILVGTEGAGIIESTNSGATWHAIPNSANVIPLVSSFFYENDSTVVVSTYARGLWKLHS